MSRSGQDRLRDIHAAIERVKVYESFVEPAGAQPVRSAVADAPRGQDGA
jgi:hypothetical protein